MTVNPQFDGIERETGESPELSVIWLHGLGADAGDFVPVIPALELPAPTRFVFPNAPPRSVTVNGGMVMRAWYDIRGFGPATGEDEAGLAESVVLVRHLVEREIERGVTPERIVLAGFSQGGAVVLHAGLGGPHRLGGILGLSTYLPAEAALTADGPPHVDVPVWLAHGTEDVVIPVGMAEYAARVLRGLGVPVELSTWRMGHELIAAEIAAINAWFQRFAIR